MKIRPPAWPDTEQYWLVTEPVHGDRSREDWIALARALRDAGYHVELTESVWETSRIVDLEELEIRELSA